MPVAMGQGAMVVIVATSTAGFLMFNCKNTKDQILHGHNYHYSFLSLLLVMEEEQDKKNSEIDTGTGGRVLLLVCNFCGTTPP